MEHASLIAFLTGKTGPEYLMSEIADEVAKFYADLQVSKQAFINISAGPTFEMTRSAARRLLDAVDNQQISANAAVYIADCIVASDNIDFADQATREAVAFIEDDSARFLEGRAELWTHEEISRVLATLD